MSAAVDAVAIWLGDVHLLAAVLLAGVLGLLLLVRQPARRMAIEKATLAALAALAVLCALPGWSAVHLLAAAAEPVAAPDAPASNGDQQITISEFEFKLEEFNSYPVPPVADAESLVQADAANLAAPVAVPASASISWPAALVAVQAIGSAAVVAWLAMGAILIRRVRRETRPAPSELAVALRSVVGKQVPPELRVSERVPAPVALGLRRPAIILPASFAAPAGPAAKSNVMPVLAHEWAHITGGDLRSLAASRLLLVLLWPQPLFWLLRRALRLDQETLADAAAAEVAGRVSYAEQLVNWARTATTAAPRMAGAVGLWEGPSQLKRRIATLLDEKLTVLRQCSRRWRVGTACAALVAAGILSLVTLQRQEVAEAAVAPDAAQRNASSPADVPVGTEADVPPSDDRATISGRIVMEEGTPATVAGWLYSETQAESHSWVSTEGHYTDSFSIATHAGTIWLKYFAGGFAPAWAGPLEVAAGAERNDVELVLRAGHSASVQVVDEQGAAVAGARFVAHPLIGESVSGPRIELSTDERGFVELTHLADLPYAMGVEAPGFQPLGAEVQLIEPEKTVQLVMRAVRPATGIVRDAEGAPVAGAQFICRVVTRQGNALYLSSMPMATTDAEGRFQLDQLADDAYYGFVIVAPDNGRLVVNDLAAGVEGAVYDMPARRDLRGQVRGDLGRLHHRDGKPFVIVRQRIVFRWPERNYSDLLGEDMFVTPTDGGSEFVYRGLVDGEVEVIAGDRTLEFDVAEEGDTDVVMELEVDEFPDDAARAATTGEGAWTLVPAVVPTAPNATLMPPAVGGSGVLDREQSALAAPADPAPQLEFRAEFVANQVDDATAGEAAESAAPSATEALAAEERKEIPAWARREPNVVKGRVVDENGEPLAGAEVTLYLYDMGVASPDESETQRLATRTTGDDGEFRFDDAIDVAQAFPGGLPDDRFPTPPTRVVAVVGRATGRAPAWNNSTASAVVRDGDAGQLVLKPAATLRGRVTGPEGQPVAGAKVTADVGVTGLDLYSTVTDTEGRYEIDDVAAFDAEQFQKEISEAIFLAAQPESTPSVSSYIHRKPLLVQHPNYATRRVEIRNIPGELDVELQPGAAIEGLVVLRDRDGVARRAADVTVQLVRQLPERAPGAEIDPWAYQTASARADAAGRYRVAPLPAGKYLLTAYEAGWVTLGVQDVEAAAEETVEAPELALTRGGTVRIKLVDAATGAALEIPDGTRGWVNVTRRPLPPLGVFALRPNFATFNDARAEVRLPAGDYVLLVNIPGDTPTGAYWQSTNVKDLETAAAHPVVEGEASEAVVEMEKIAERRPTATLRSQLVPSAALPEAEGETEDKAEASEAEDDVGVPHPRNDFVPAVEPADP